MTAPDPNTPAIPRPPRKPPDEECCHRGCDPCIFDYYWRALERWEERVEKLGLDPRAVLAAMGEGVGRECEETVGVSLAHVAALTLNSGCEAAQLKLLLNLAATSARRRIRNEVERIRGWRGRRLLDGGGHWSHARQQRARCGWRHGRP